MGIGLIWLLARLKDARAFRLAMGGLAVVLWLDYQRHQPAVMETAPRELLRLPHPVLAEIGPEVRQRRARMALLGQTQLENAFRNKGTGEETLLYARLDQFLNLNLVDGVMKFDGFFALWFAEQDDLRRVLHSMSATGLRPGLADFLGIAYTTSTESPLVWNARPTARPLVTAGQEPVFETATDCVERLSDPAFDSSRIASLRPGAREWVEASGTTNARVELTRFDAHEVAFTVTTDVPTLAVIAQGFYHPWKPTIDGKPARLLRANHAYQAVSVPGGRSEVRLRYVDNAFRLGLALSIVGLVLLGLLWWRWRPLAAEHPA
jgi:hypothetical protein